MVILGVKAAAVTQGAADYRLRTAELDNRVVLQCLYCN